MNWLRFNPSRSSPALVHLLRLSSLSRFSLTSTMATQHEVLIIGSGLSALSAARALKAHKPLLLEARSRIGGRAQTYTATDSPVDLGCSMIHGYKEGNPLRKVLEEYGLVSPLLLLGVGGPLLTRRGAPNSQKHTSSLARKL